ncbi:hypothetical protein R9C00_29390 [Flammeovirgaceae bacterium SG7u.111]|nr:hypothetical protein [Flammeovirgaceae bacterium SG7u.132]WPO35815.1 hypothetical protein R9C00_29390 [Flammeovirgaceae bacterium SG7u.111]
MEKLFEQKNVVVEYDNVNNYLYINWIGFQREEDIYKAGEAALKIFQGLDCTKILNDNTNVKGPWNKAAEWTQSYWFPEMIKAGLQKFAWVFSENLFAELSATQAMPNTDLVHKFSTYEKAEEWLLS